jgi:DNA polymerase III subunit beta
MKMKFTIEKNIILEALNNVTRALSQKITIPVLQGIKFELTKEGLYLMGSDSELTIKSFIPEKNIKKVEGTGIVIIQSKYILDIIRKMPSDIIDFEVEDDLKIKISTPSNEYKLNCYNPDDYPNIVLESSKEFFGLKANILKEIVNQTSYAMSTQEVRPLLTGMNFKVNGDILECIATDSYRLSKKVLNLTTSTNMDINIVIPGRSIIEIEKILGDNEDEVQIHVFSNKILFKYNDIMVQSNLLSGSYPQTSHFIPNDFAYMINLPLKEYYDAIDRAALLAQNKEKNIVKLRIQDKEMVITSGAAEIGKTEEKLMVDSNKKEKLEISFSSRYMLDALKVLKDDNLLLLINTDDKPIIIKSVTDETLTELILPIKTF